MTWVEITSLTVTIAASVYGIWSGKKLKRQREWVHMSLVNLKPSIQGSNKNDAIAAINNMLEFLKPPKKNN